MSTKTFAEWLADEIKKSGLSNSEVARRAGVSHARISQILGGDPPGNVFLQKIASVFGKSRSETYRAAGLVDRMLDDQTPSLRELISKFAQLSEDDQESVLKMVRALDEMHQAEKRRAGRLKAKTR